jgi:1-acyl-sn-glycerol-3-phosphate acyltransferase
MSDVSQRQVRNLTRFCTHCLRVAATSAAWAVFCIGVAFFGGIAAPVLTLFYKDRLRRQERMQRVVHFGCRFYLGFLKVLKLARIEIEGGEYLDAVEGAVIAANHPTLVDILVILALKIKLTAVAKPELWRNFLFRKLLAASSQIKSEPTLEFIQAAAERLKQGDSLVIFPEGTRTSPNKPIRLRRGAANIALAARAPILPVVIRCHPLTLQKGSHLLDVPERTPVISLRIYPPIDNSYYLNQAGGNELVAARRITEYLQEFFSNRLTDDKFGQF